MYFASYREITGLGEEEVELPDGSTVGALLEAVRSLHGLPGGGGRMLVAVNGEYVDAGARLREGDVAALFPPVSGG